MNKMKSSRQASSKLVLLALVASLGFQALNSKPASGADERALTTDKSDPLYLDKGVTNFVASSLSPDGKYLATPGGENSILFYEVASGKIIRRLTGASRWISFSADGTQLSALGSDGQIRIWDVESGKQIASVKVGSKLVDDIKQPKLSPDKKLLAFGDSRSLKIVEVADGHQISEIGEPNVFPFGFSFDGKKIVGSSKIRMRSIRSRLELRSGMWRPDARTRSFQLKKLCTHHLQSILPTTLLHLAMACSLKPLIARQGRPFRPRMED
jgi:WD40 repeat protein